MSRKQLLLWIPKAETICGTAIIPEVPFDHPIPEDMFLLPDYPDENVPPELPLSHDSGTTITQEDRTNWNINDGYFVYMNRDAEGGVWALFEY